MTAVLRARLRDHLVHPNTGVRPDWIVILLPTVIAMRTFSAAGSVFALGLLVAVTLLRKPEGRFRLQAGPLLLLFASAAIVYSRPASIGPLLTFLLVGLLVVRLVTTVDARRIIGSLIDGCGLYLVLNVLLYVAGIQSPNASNRIGGLVESSGFVRTIFPLTWSINIPPIIAAVYIAASIFLLREAGPSRRFVRLVCLMAAIFVLVSAGTRVPVVIAALLSIAIICFPFIARWVAQASVLLAAVSAVALPGIFSSIQFVIAPLMSLVPGRAYDARLIGSLNGRDYIWERSIRYWIDWVSDLPSMLFGYGVNGQYRSGASATYRNWISSIVKDLETAYMHNSFLQQLFDGGLLGWLLLVFAIYWGSVRLAKRRIAWGYWGTIAIVATTVLILSAMTEASIAPGPAQESFWLLIVLIGVSCQISGGNVDSDSYTADAKILAQTV